MKLFSIFAVITMLTLNMHAQSFQLDDPNNIYKSEQGVVLERNKVKALISQGSFSMKSRKLQNGKTEIIIIPIAEKEIAKQKNITEAWIERWKGKKLPDFELKTLKNQLVSSSDLKNKLVVMNFWFIACKPCVNEMPELNRLVEKYKDEQIAFLAPSFDNEPSLIAFSKHTTFDYTILVNAKDVIQEMNISSYPTHLIIDRNGVIREILIGGSTHIYKNIDELIQKLKL